MGDGEDREEVGDIPGRGNRLWPGEKMEDMEEGDVLPGRDEGGWKAEGNDLRMGWSPDMEGKMGRKAPVLVRQGSRDSNAGWRKGG